MHRETSNECLGSILAGIGPEGFAGVASSHSAIRGPRLGESADGVAAPAARRSEHELSLHSASLRDLGFLLAPAKSLRSKSDRNDPSMLGAGKAKTPAFLRPLRAARSTTKARGWSFAPHRFSIRVSGRRRDSARARDPSVVGTCCAAAGAEGHCSEHLSKTIHLRLRRSWSAR